MKNRLAALAVSLFAGCLAGCNPYNTYPTEYYVQKRGEAENEHRQEQTEIVVDAVAGGTQTVVDHVTDTTKAVTPAEFHEAIEAIRADTTAQVAAATDAANQRIAESRAAADARAVEITSAAVDKANQALIDAGKAAASVVGLQGLVDNFGNNLSKTEDDLISRLDAGLAELGISDIDGLDAVIGGLQESGDDGTGLAGLVGLLGVGGGVLAKTGRSRASAEIEKLRDKIEAMREDAALRRPPPTT